MVQPSEMERVSGQLSMQMRCMPQLTELVWQAIDETRLTCCVAVALIWILRTVVLRMRGRVHGQLWLLCPWWRQLQWLWRLWRLWQLRSKLLLRQRWR